ncbi:hypothetical protein BGZ96_004143 [Linnemannia gamsii]|uniref:EF-hand domain-containing protein n=1 Tax=Linnemannia gamsii TaxID=64522 RepID=A0ABQ7JJ30_9FUNG|nr:hypothetical protein BGZ96_004143 [Linnemannia gamsii]
MMKRRISGSEQDDAHNDNPNTVTTTYLPTKSTTLSNRIFYSYFLSPLPPSSSPSEFKEAFNLFDRKGSGNIAASSLGDLLRSIGQNPTQSEIQELVAQADPSSTGVVSFDAFSKIAMRADGFKPAGTTDQLIEGFKVFDPLNNGTIPATELRHVLTTMGEVLSAEEVDDLMAGALVDKDGLVNYEVFVRDLLAA